MHIRRTRDLVFPALFAACSAWSGYGFALDATLVIALVAMAAFLGTLIIWVRSDETLPTPAPPPMPETEGQGQGATPEELIRAIPVGVLMVSGDQTILMANAAAHALFGLPNLAGLPVESLRARKLLDAIDQTAATGEMSTIEFTLTRAHDAFLRVHAASVGAGPDGRHAVVVTIEDETAIRQANDLHRDFVANASHELKTPLAVVSGLIETLLGPARNDRAASDRFLGMLSLHTSRMTELINDLMSLNRIELNERVAPHEDFPLRGIVEEAVDALKPVAVASGVVLEMDDMTAGLVVRADREQLSQLFVNLIDNAIKYGGGKPVTVRVADEPGEAGLVRLSVIDKGPGIERRHLPRLTERFYRIDANRSREQGGTGLGLAICKHIAVRHRGRLDIASTVGEGSTFSVILPCRVDAEDRPRISVETAARKREESSV